MKTMSIVMRGVLRMLGLGLLMLGVTVGGVMAGALFTSPAATSMPWIRPAVAIVAALVAIVALAVWLRPSTLGASSSANAKLAKAAQSAAKSAKGGPTFLMPTMSMPSISLSGKADRTPRAVQALAAAGTAPSEISWRTGLPLDAVALLLAMSTASRQLQPPTA